MLQALSKALLDLRADMVTQAQDDVKANVEKASSEHNVQRLIEKTTKELHVGHKHIVLAYAIKHHSYI